MKNGQKINVQILKIDFRFEIKNYQLFNKPSILFILTNGNAQHIQSSYILTVYSYFVTRILRSRRPHHQPCFTFKYILFPILCIFFLYIERFITILMLFCDWSKIPSNKKNDFIIHFTLFIPNISLPSS